MDRNIIDSSLYLPHHTNTFKCRVAKLYERKDHFVFGDCNARHKDWNGSSPNNAGRQLMEMQVLSNNIRIMHPSTHTYMSPCAAATIDYIITNSTLPVTEISRVEDLFSDL